MMHSLSSSRFPLRGKVAEGRMRADAQHRSNSLHQIYQNPQASPAALIRPSGTFSPREKGEGVLQ
jgi:hypothetical protein